MTICDICEDKNESAERIQLNLTSIGEDQSVFHYKGTIDLCPQCREQFYHYSKQNIDIDKIIARGLKASIKV